MSKFRLKGPPLSPFLTEKARLSGQKAPLENPRTVVEAFAGPQMEVDGIPLYRPTGIHQMALEMSNNPLPKLVTSLPQIEHSNEEKFTEWARQISDTMQVKDTALALAILATEPRKLVQETRRSSWVQEFEGAGLQVIGTKAIGELLEIKLTLVAAYVSAFKTAIVPEGDAGPQSMEEAAAASQGGGAETPLVPSAGQDSAGS